MAIFVFGKMHPSDSNDLVAEIEATNALLERRYPGCTARVVAKYGAGDSPDRVSVELRVTSNAESAACIGWYSAQLIRRCVIMLYDNRLG